MDVLRPLRPQLQTGLQAMQAWFQRMTNPDTHRLYYQYYPGRDAVSVKASPVRDMGTAKDLAELQASLGGRGFDAAIRATLRAFLPALVRERSWEAGGGVALSAEGLGATETEAEQGEGPLPRAFFDSRRLGEPSSVAHSAVLALALAADEWAVAVGEAEREELLVELANGILHQQRRSDGTYKVYFDAARTSDSGWQLYGGEAMLALMAAYERLGEERYLRSVRRGMAAYEKKWRAGEVDEDELVFFANWQSQAGRKLLRHTTDTAAAAAVRSYLFALQNAIVRVRGFFDEAERAPGRVATVEVACGLEGLADVFAVAAEEEGEEEAERLREYGQAIRAAVSFLAMVQSQPGQGPPAAEGGFGHGLEMPTQRIDVTGHVASAYLKLIEILDAPLAS